VDILPGKYCSVLTQDTPIDLRSCDSLIWSSKPGPTYLRCKANKVTGVVLVYVEIELTLGYLEIFKPVCISRGKRLLASSSLFVRSSAHIHQRGSHWMDFCEIWYLWLLLKFVDKLQIWLKSNKKYLALYIQIELLLYCGRQYKIFCSSPQWKGNPFLRFHGKTRRFYIVNSYMYVDNRKVTHCCVSMAAVVTWTRHSVYVGSCLAVSHIFRNFDWRSGRPSCAAAGPMTPLFAVYSEFGCKQDSGMRNSQTIPMYPKGRQREYKVSCCNASAEFMKARELLLRHLDHLNFLPVLQRGWIRIIWKPRYAFLVKVVSKRKKTYIFGAPTSQDSVK